MSVLEAGIGWLAPPQCVGCGQEGAALCENCSISGILPFGERCAFCAKLSPGGRTCMSCRSSGGPRFVWISTSYEGLAQKLVQGYKFGHLRAAGTPISALMSQTLAGATVLESTNYLVVPLPTATGRVRQRSFDHSALLAKTIAKRFGLEYAQALGRFGQSRQLGASRQIRLHQQASNFFARVPHRIAGRNILLIDDVVTTGGSIAAAAKELRAAGAQHVDALVFAKRL